MMTGYLVPNYWETVEADKSFIRGLTFNNRVLFLLVATRLQLLEVLIENMIKFQLVCVGNIQPKQSLLV